MEEVAGREGMKHGVEAHAHRVHGWGWPATIGRIAVCVCRVALEDQEGVAAYTRN